MFLGGKHVYASNLLIGVGILILTFAGVKAETHYRQYNTPTTIQGLMLKGRVEFNEHDSLVSGYLAKDDTVFTQPLPAGTWIVLNRDGRMKLCDPSREVSIQGHPCHGGDHGWFHFFYPSGRLESCGLAESQVIDSIPCVKATFWTEIFGGGGRTYFFEDGRLRSAKVASRIVYRGTEIKKGMHIRLKPNGDIESVH